VSQHPDSDWAQVGAIVFDLDGTLIDSYAAIAESLNHARAFWDLPALPISAVRLLVGHGLEALVADHVGADRVERGVLLFREKYAAVFAEKTRALPGASQALESLYGRGYRLAVASNKPARFSRPILERLKMLGWLSFVAGPDTAGSTKPEPQMIRSCLAAMQIEPQRSLYVGDMVLDVESADRASVGVALVTGGSATRSDLQRTGRPVLTDLGELLELLPDRAPF
jgi:phosphoglycolate phosphatase